MCLRCRISQECFHTAQTFRKFDHAYFFKNFKCMLFAVHIKCQHRAKAPCLFFHDLISRMLRQSRIDDLCHSRLRFQPVCDLKCIFLRLLHTNAQCFDATQDQPAVKRCQSRTCRFDQETKLFTDLFSVRHKEACQCIIVSPQKLRSAMYHNICSQRQRILEIRRQKCVVYN